MSEIHAGLINPTEMLYTPTRESLDKLRDTLKLHKQHIFIFLSGKIGQTLPPLLPQLR